MRVPQLHIGAVGGVTNVQRIKHQQAAAIARMDVLNQPVPTILANGLKVRQIKPRLFPFPKGAVERGPISTPIGVIWCVVSQRLPPCGVNLADVTVVEGCVVWHCANPKVLDIYV